MSYVPTETLQQARQMDLLTYLQLNEPGELVRISNNNYCTREHDSLKISNGKWYWFSRGIGGVSALDYLIKVRGLALPDAVGAIIGHYEVEIPKKKKVRQEIRQILLPEKNNNNNQVIRYLRGRGIHPVVIQYCIDHDILYESKDHHNAVFIGKDSKGRIRYAALRGTIGAYKGEATGSDKHYSFRITDNPDARHLHLFESAIDLLSYASFQHMKGQDWGQDALLSLAGVFQMKRGQVIPAALQMFLNDNKDISTVHLHLDNDETGRGAAIGIREGLPDRYKVLDEPPSCGKDINEQLMIKLGLMSGRKEAPTR